MTASTTEYVCSACKAPHFGEGGTPCELCGHVGRTIEVTVEDNVSVQTGFRVQGYEVGKSRKKGLFADLRERWQHSISLGEDVYRVQHIDKRAEPPRYTEVVRDKQGNVIHETDEPLKAHQGRGSDKPELRRMREIEGKNTGK